MPNPNLTANSIKDQLKEIDSIEALLTFFEIGFEQSFVDEYGQALLKRFNGNIFTQQPEDWFSYRRALKRAYCNLQRKRLPSDSRKACRGCTSCERR
ncbi:nitrogen fixation protein NifW [Corallincola platygyrae]|uniref:Nitrogen fixation protein NifW n=1 Tax=Corallincola platygyrae TaxID=1193278 RepID=A0ABW4XMY8_9GAMM